MNSNLKTKYQKEAAPALIKEFGKSNLMAVPKIEKVVVNVGIGKIAQEKDKIGLVSDDLRKITGQQPLRTKSKKSISGFKTRTGLVIGLKVTLRGTRMWQFLNRFVNFALPRVRDFQGISLSSVDGAGNLNIGIKEQIIFPEVMGDQANYIFPFQVTVTTTAKDRESGLALFKALNFPLATQEVKKEEEPKSKKNSSK